MAPQRRRGGKHAVKDEDLTYTKYDDCSHEQLLVAVKEAGCYVKDDKKSVLARKLADHDRTLQNAERRAVQERNKKEERRQQEIKDAVKAKKDRRKARAKRNEENGTRRERGEDVSSNSEDTADAEEENRHGAHQLTVTGGKALSDETCEDTCSDTTINSENPPIMPDCKLRLFEWSYVTMPPVTVPPHACSEDFPRQLTYAPLKVITTESYEKITLPGQKDPAGDPDYVPVLDPLTRSAARHGHMIGLLAYATIECAMSWATRSIVQGWNGRMYFSPPLYNDVEDIRLDAVYRKWHIEQSKLLHPTPGITDLQIDRKRRFAQRLANKRKAVGEVYETCKWRPLAVSYMPAYLDWEKGIGFAALEHFNKSIDNLYYVRFPGCDLPHYYFWAGKGEWTDLTTPDPSWSPEMFKQQGTVDEAVDAYTRMPPTQLRVKKLTPVPPLRYDSPNSSDPVTSPSNIERDLYTHGLSATLIKYKAFATSVEKGEAWAAFTRKLPVLYPSGEMPSVPPVTPAMGMCVAEKIAGLMCGCAVLPCTGGESWTRDDDALWDIVARVDDEEVGMCEDDAAEEGQNLPRSSSGSKDEVEDGVQALYRRDNMDILMHPKEKHVWDWLDNISSMYSQRIAPRSPIATSSKTEINGGPISPLDLNNTATWPTCPFCNTDWQTTKDFEKAEHMLSHSHVQLKHTTTAASRIDAIGVGVKRRHSLLSVRTLRSYHVNQGKGKKMSKADLAASLLEHWAKFGGEDSPFTREVRRAKQGRALDGEGGGGRFGIKMGKRKM